jgi:hypothetical protein
VKPSTPPPAHKKLPLPPAAEPPVKKDDVAPPQTPAKTSEIIVRPEPRSLLDFAIGGTPQRKSNYEIQKEAKTAKIRTLNTKPKKTLNETLEYNDLREELSGVPNPNKEIATGIIAGAVLRNKIRPLYKQGKEQYDSVNKIKGAIKTKVAMNKLDDMKVNASIENAKQNDAAISIQKIARGKQARKEKEQKQNAVNTLQAQIKRRNEQERVIKNAKQEVKDIENKKITRGTTEERAQQILTLNKGVEIIKSKMAIRNVGRPRKSNAMSELEKQVSGQLLPA